MKSALFMNFSIFRYFFGFRHKYLDNFYKRKNKNDITFRVQKNDCSQNSPTIFEKEQKMSWFLKRMSCWVFVSTGPEGTKRISTSSGVRAHCKFIGYLRAKKEEEEENLSDIHTHKRIIIGLKNLLKLILEKEEVHLDIV